MKPRGRRTFGADEAGRGPILGPLVIAVVALDRGGAISLSRRGVSDSKRFGAGPKAKQRRAELAVMVKSRAVLHAVKIVPAKIVDEYTFEGRLNELEREVVRDLLHNLGATSSDRIICDGANMFRPLQEVFPQLEAVDQGESAHVSVAAASILAKDARDVAFAKIAARYEQEFGTLAGGGYLNAATRRFLDAYERKYGGLPQEARRSWGAKKIQTPDAHAVC